MHRELESPPSVLSLKDFFHNLLMVRVEGVTVIT
ncbi:hypothetical protein HRbin01_01941 [archaeon HR01]|nr:hypothetical protein HRbin01_01941 [archaeon HR01]